MNLALLAKAPIPGLAKTRLIAALGADGAAALQAELIARAVATACAAQIGPVTLWTAPDAHHPHFDSLARAYPIRLVAQPDGDLGWRMLTALGNKPALVIGTDCPTLSAAHLHAAADVLAEGLDTVVLPAEDGGYGLIGTNRPLPALFNDMEWSTAEVMAETRRRLRRLGLAWREPATLWDVDRPADLPRLAALGFPAELIAPRSN